MRRTLAIAVTVVALVAIPAAVIAATGGFNSALDRQASRWTTTSATTSSKRFRNVPRMALTRCTRGQVTVMINVTVSGGPVLFQIVVDGVPEAPVRPGPARFVPDGKESFSYSFVAFTAPFEADDTHSFNVQWRSPTGATVKFHRGALNLLFQTGAQGCP